MVPNKKYKIMDISYDAFGVEFISNWGGRE